MAPLAFFTLLIFIGVSAIQCMPAEDSRRRVTYIALHGNCPGAFLIDVSLKTMNECKQHCTAMPRCIGFSYSNARDICFLKRESCTEPIIGSEFTFYQKFDQQGLTDIPKLIAESTAIDDPASLFAQGVYYPQASSSDTRGPIFFPRIEGLQHNRLTNSPGNNNNNNNQWKQFLPERGAVIEMMGPNGNDNNLFAPPLSMRQALTAQATVPTPDCTKNAGTNNEFVLMFMFNMPDQPKTVDLEIYVSSEPSPGNVATDVEITMPRYPAYAGNRGSVAPGQTVLFKLPQNVRLTATGMEPKAIHVTVKNPNAKISVYAVNRETFTADGFLVFPTAQLGLEHYVLTWQPSTRGSEFGMAAPYDDTSVQIILPAVAPPGSEPAQIIYNGKTYTNGDTISVTMQANDAFLAINENLNSDLTGTRLISTRPLAVFSGDKRTAIKYISGDPPTRDHLVEQLPPVHAWGTEFVFCTSPNRTDGDFMKIVASQDATQILVYGGVSGPQQRTVPSPGSFVLIETAPQECLYISSTKPVMVGKFVVSQKPDQTVERTDPAAVVIPPTSSYRSAYSFLTPEYTGLTPGEVFTHFILIGVKKDYKDGFIVDGQPMPLQQIVPTYNDYICGYLLVQSGQHSIQHSKPDAKFLSILYGAADRESYAFVLGETLAPICGQLPPTSTPPIIVQNCTQPGTLLGTCPYCQEAFVAQGCYGNILSLSCPANRVVKVIAAHYGWFPGICGGAACGIVPQGNCGMYNVYDNIARFCNGQSSCNFPVATNALFSNLQFANYFCPLCSTRVQVHYTCILANALPCANLVGRTPLFVRYTASSFWRREPGRSDITCPDDISMLTPIDAMAIPAYLPEFARYAAPHGLMWCPSECDTNSSYLQVDLGRVSRISGYAIQGRLGFDQFVNAVSVDYSSDGRSWMSLSNSPSIPAQASLGMTGSGTSNAVFDGNNDAENVMVCDLTAFGIDARYLRVWVRGYQGYPCMRFDIFSCGEGPQQNGTYNQSFPIGPAYTLPGPILPAGTTTAGPAPPTVTTPAGGGPTTTLANPATPAPTTTLAPIEAPIPPGCPPLAIANSDATGAPNQRGIMGQRTTVHCLGEWMLPDFSIEFTVICDTSGNWVGSDSQCTEVRNCGPIPDVDHARYVANGDPLRVGGSVTYSCDAGYKLIGNPTLTCQTSTLWTAIPHCDAS